MTRTGPNSLATVQTVPLPKPPQKSVPFDREDMHALLKTVSNATLIECLQLIGGRVSKSRYWMISDLLNYMDDPVDLRPRRVPVTARTEGRE